jgi:hypothetical protein
MSNSPTLRRFSLLVVCSIGALWPSPDPAHAVRADAACGRCVYTWVCESESQADTDCRAECGSGYKKDTCGASDECGGSQYLKCKQSNEEEL